MIKKKIIKILIFVSISTISFLNTHNQYKTTYASIIIDNSLSNNFNNYVLNTDDRSLSEILKKLFSTKLIIPEKNQNSQIEINDIFSKKDWNNQIDKNSIISKEDWDKLNEYLTKDNKNNLKSHFKIFKEKVNIENAKLNNSKRPCNEVDLEYYFDCENNIRYLRVKNFKLLPSSSFGSLTDGFLVGEHYGINYDNLKEGDLIVAVNGRRVQELKSNHELNDLIEEINTNQNLDIDFLRPNKNDEKNLLNMKFKSRLNRNALKVLEENACFQKIDDNSILIKYGNIDFNTVTLAEDQLERIENNKKIQNLIIDLRDCKEGIFAATRKLAGMFLPKENAYLAMQSFGCDELPFVLKNFVSQILKRKIKISLIVGENTSNTAEMLASILKTSANATIYGKKPKNKNFEYEGIIVYDEKSNNQLYYILFPKYAYKAVNDELYDVNIKSIDSVDVDFEYDDFSKILDSITHNSSNRKNLNLYNNNNKFILDMSNYKTNKETNRKETNDGGQQLPIIASLDINNRLAVLICFLLNMFFDKRIVVNPDKMVVNPSNVITPNQFFNEEQAKFLFEIFKPENYAKIINAYNANCQSNNIDTRVYCENKGSFLNFILQKIKQDKNNNLI